MDYEKQVQELGKRLPLDKTKPHHSGTSVREQWPVGHEVFFEPKGLLIGMLLKGVIETHIYKNVLIVREIDSDRKWFVSTHRCQKVES